MHTVSQCLRTDPGCISVFDVLREIIWFSSKRLAQTPVSCFFSARVLQLAGWLMIPQKSMRRISTGWRSRTELQKLDVGFTGRTCWILQCWAAQYLTSATKDAYNIHAASTNKADDSFRRYEGLRAKAEGEKGKRSHCLLQIVDTASAGFVFTLA